MPEALDSDGLREVLTYYDSWLAFNQHYLRIPGVQVAVVAAGSVAFSAAYGVADAENDVPLTEQHLFRIASHSKTFTATAVLQLVEQGKLRLDDQASQHVTEIVGTTLGDRTVRELLAHAGGITRDSVAADWWQLDTSFPDRDQLLAVLREESSAVLPENERFKYSNIGYGLLGLIIEAAAGTSYNSYVQQAIVDKLGLTELGPELDPARSSEYAAGYSALAYADRRVPIEHVDTRALAAATGFFGNARDLATYFSAHLPGDDRLLTDKSKREMQHPLWQTTDKDWPRYGLGLQIAKVGERRLFGHGGGYPGHITRSLVDGSAGIAVSVLTNAIDGPAQQLAEGFFKLLDLAGSKDRPADVAGLSRFTGRYANLWGVSDIVQLGGRLYGLDPTGGDPADQPTGLEVDGDSLLVTEDYSGAYGQRYQFTFDAEGRPETVRHAMGLSAYPLDRFTLPDRVTVR
ncbi:serine hydrolase domain-containing protein [Kribbella sp. NPDC051952]|uniref:serine hydrolase domain-containing protein n=1 Tax=Kribbella sp. NPDC051952 TaxID=3154851 RepID=UPI00341A59FB